MEGGGVREDAHKQWLETGSSRQQYKQYKQGQKQVAASPAAASTAVSLLLWCWLDRMPMQQEDSFG